MLDGIKPLANNVLAKLMQDYYPNWYTKYTVQSKKNWNYIFVII